MRRTASKNGRSVAEKRKRLEAQVAALEARLHKARAQLGTGEDFDVRDAKEFLDVLVKRVESDGERLYLRRGEKRVAALVPADEAEFLSEWEDRHDIEAARKAVNEPSRPWEEIKKELGL